MCVLLHEGGFVLLEPSFRAGQAERACKIRAGSRGTLKVQGARQACAGLTCMSDQGRLSLDVRPGQAQREYHSRHRVLVRPVQGACPSTDMVLVTAGTWYLSGQCSFKAYVRSGQAHSGREAGAG